MKICKEFKGRFVKKHSCRTIIAIAEVVAPYDETIPVEIPKREILEEADTFFLLVGKTNRFFIRILLFFISFILPLLFFKYRTFSSLSFETRYKIMKKLHDSPMFSLRGLYIMASMLILPYYYSIPEVLQRIGYPYDRFYHKKREVA